MYKMELYNKFMFKHNAKGTKNPITHTRIGDKDLNIFAGAFSIPENELAEFYKLYIRYLQDGNKEYLTESQLKNENGQMVVDLDFRYNYDIETKQHTEEEIDNLINAYLEEFKKYFVFDKQTNIPIWIMEKPNVNRLEDSSLTKDGIHLIFGLSVPYDIQLEIRKSMIENASDIFELPLTNSWESVFDKGLSAGTCNWMLYGSQKPANEAYQVIKSYEVCYDECDGEFMMNPIEFVFNRDFEKISAQYKAPKYEFNLKYNRIQKNTFKPISPSPTSIATDFDIDFTDCNTEISKLLNIIGNSRCDEGKQAEWSSVGQVIKNEMKDDGLNEFVNWTNKFGTENKKKEAITHYQKYIKFTPKKDKNRLSIASLHYWAKQNNQLAYLKAFPLQNKEVIEFTDEDKKIFELLEPILFTRTEYDKAFAFKEIYNGKYVCIDSDKREYYCFNDTNKLWEYDKGGSPIRNKISTDFYNLFEKYKNFIEIEIKDLEPNSDNFELFNKKAKAISELMIDLKKTNDKNNVLKELSDICKNVKFEKTLNRSEYLLPTNDGKVLNMETLISTDRTIDNKFSFECNAKFIPYNEVDENFKKVDEYFNSLFCNNQDTKQVVLNIFKSVFTGKVLRYIYFCIGSGRNGKSLLFKILNKIFGGFMDIISENVIVEQKGNKSALNTEVEKLDKCRLGYVTELKETDKMNEKVIKQITGGDDIDLRTLQTKNQSMKPTCNLFVLTNEMPSFNAEAQSVLDRLITIPFKAIFEINTTFETEMLELSDYIFTYIMVNGKITDNIIQTLEMKEESKIHIKSNTDTTLEEFLNDNLIDCENDNDNKPLLLNDIRIAFENYCLINKLKNPLTQKKFTTKMKSLKLVIKESNSKTRLYGKRFKEDSEKEE